MKTTTEKRFSNVVAYIYSEPEGAGMNGTLQCLTYTREIFCVSDADEDVDWQWLQKNFLAITKIAWSELFSYGGSHLICDREYAEYFMQILDGMDKDQIMEEGLVTVEDLIDGGVVRNEYEDYEFDGQDIDCEVLADNWF